MRWQKGKEIRQPTWTWQWRQSKEMDNVSKQKMIMIRIYLACVFICLVSLFTQESILFGFNILGFDFKTIAIYCWCYKPRPSTTKRCTYSCSKHWLVTNVFQFRHKTRKSYPFKWQTPFKPNVGISPRESSPDQTLQEIGGLRGLFL